MSHEVYEPKQFICTQCEAELDEFELHSVKWEDGLCPYCFAKVMEVDWE